MVFLQTRRSFAYGTHQIEIKKKPNLFKVTMKVRKERNVAMSQSIGDALLFK
jgi:hypothetical protein